MRILTAALALAVLAALPAAPEAQDRPAGAAASIDGWQREVAETGTVYFHCRAATCPVGAAVSYRMQPGDRALTLEDFRTHHEVLNRRMVEQSGGRFVRVEMIEVAQSSEAGAQVLTAVKAVEEAAGDRQFMASSLVTDGPRRFTMVSTGRTEADARTGLRMFLPVVMMQTQPGGSQPRR